MADIVFFVPFACLSHTLLHSNFMLPVQFFCFSLYLPISLSLLLSLVHSSFTIKDKTGDILYFHIRSTVCVYRTR